MRFVADDGRIVPAVTAEQMREVDRLAVEEFGLGILQMMENAGRTLAEHVLDVLGQAPSEVVVLAGSGGNGGGGLCCARHLHNRGWPVSVVLDRDPADLRGAAAHQYRTLTAAGLRHAEGDAAPGVVERAGLVVDALIGYGLKGAPRGRTEALVRLCNTHAARVLALDVPSGLDATTGEAPGVVVRADRVLTLALPKTGLGAVDADLYLADLGIPGAVYERLGIPVFTFGGPFWLRLYRA